MSPAKVAGTTVLFPPHQQARLSLPRLPGTLPSFPVMACEEKPLVNGVLSPVSTAADSRLNSSLSWYKRLPGRNRHLRLEPLPEDNKTFPVNERTACGPSGSNKLNPAGTPTKMKGASGTKTRAKLSPRSRPEERTRSKKENSETARRRPMIPHPSGEKFSGKQRMSYPPCTGPTQRAEWADLPTVKKTNSCPVLCDLENLTITPKKTEPLATPSHKCQQLTEKAMSRLGINNQHKIKQDSSKRHGEHDRLRVPDANNSRPRHRRSRNSREESRIQRPKPPSWQDLPNEQTTGSVTTQEPVITHTYAVSESVHIIPGYRCDSATTRSTVESERRAVRANIRRTRSRIIDSNEIPKAESVLPLSQTKPCEFHLRKTYHDDTVYMLENAQRCRKWLAALEKSDVTPHVDQSATSKYFDHQNDNDETVTCDVEISHDKWNFLGSPYPTSSECSSEDQ